MHFKKPKIMKKTFYLLGLIGLLISSTICAQERDFSFQEKYEMKSNPSMKIKTNDGFIDVYPSNSNTIQVNYIVKKRGHLVSIDRKELEKHLNIDVQHNGSSLNIEVRRNKDGYWRNWKDRYHVSFEIKVPKTTSCDLKSSDGNIYLKGLEANHICKTSDGNIDVSFIKGDVKGTTSDGDIFANDVFGYADFKTSDGNVKTKNIIGECSFVTSDGNVTTYNVKGEVYAHTSDGNIIFEDLKGSLKAETSDGHIKGNVLELYEELDLSTSDGDIEVVVPEGLGLDLELRGERISVDLDDYRRNTNKKKLYSTVNDGGILVSLSTHDGKISLRDR